MAHPPSPPQQVTGVKIPSSKKEAEHLARRARDATNCRRRKRLGLRLLKLEAGDWEFGLATRYAGLQADQIGDRNEEAAAVGRLLRRALVALIEKEESQKK